MTRRALLAVLLAVLPTSALAQGGATGLEIRYVRDSEEYATLTRQVYRIATGAVQQARASLGRGQVWAVVLDVDETALDNSAYQLERAAYGLPFDNASWNAWVQRREAPAVPGVLEFVTAVRQAGGRIAWISGRDEVVREDTRANLERVGLWNATDRLCLEDPADTAYVKARRRAEVLAGAGRCAWEREPAVVPAYVGDQLSDFPRAGEAAPSAGQDAAFGTQFFLLPNPMYGRWTRRVTRQRR